MTMAHSLLAPFRSQPALCARVCLPALWQAGLREKLASNPYRSLAIIEKLSVSISTASHFSIYR